MSVSKRAMFMSVSLSAGGSATEVIPYRKKGENSVLPKKKITVYFVDIEVSRT